MKLSLKNILLTLAFAWLSIMNVSLAQELNFKVSVEKLPTTTFSRSEPQFLQILQKSIEELLNNTRWGDDVFRDFERIRGNLLLVVTEESEGRVYKAELSIQTERPVFNSNYSTPILKIQDKNVVFGYNEMTVLQKTTNNFNDNLSSILSFYAYYILGMDYDSFKNNGGDAFFRKANEVISSLPASVSGDPGWKNDTSSKRNRYWLVENALNPYFRQFRQAFYEYHRQGLDKMYDETDRSRAVILSSLTSFSQVNKDYLGTYMMQLFCDSKREEIIEIFKVADKGQKGKARTIMSELDSAYRRNYEVLN